VCCGVFEDRGGLDKVSFEPSEVIAHWNPGLRLKYERSALGGFVVQALKAKGCARLLDWAGSRLRRLTPLLRDQGRA